MSVADGIRPFVRRLQAHSFLSREEEEALLGLEYTSRVIVPGRDFYASDIEVKHCSFIAYGMMVSHDYSPTGERQLTALHIPGEMANLGTVVHPSGLGGLTALTATKVFCISHALLRSLASRYAAIGEALWRDCMLDTAINRQWLLNLGRLDSRSRISHLLCEMAIRHGGDNGPLLQYEFPVTQEDLGALTAMTSVHVNRSLKGLRDDGIVTFHRGTVVIHNWDSMVRVAKFSDIYMKATTGPDRLAKLN